MPKDLTCKHCGKDFHARRHAKYCSDDCRWAANNAVKTMKAKEVRDAQEVQFDGKRRLTGAGARRKGAGGENEVCKILTRLVGEKHVRNLDQTREGGGDVSWGPFLLEVKRTETVSMPAWQSQASKSAADKGMIPAVVWRRSGAKWWLAMPFEEFVTIFEALRVAAMNSVTGGGNGEENTG